MEAQNNGLLIVQGNIIENLSSVWYNGKCLGCPNLATVSYTQLKKLSDKMSRKNNLYWWTDEMEELFNEKKTLHEHTEYRTK